MDNKKRRKEKELTFSTSKMREKIVKFFIGCII